MFERNIKMLRVKWQTAWGPQDPEDQDRWLPSLLPCPIDTLAARESNHPENTNGSKQNWSSKSLLSQAKKWWKGSGNIPLPDSSQTQQKNKPPHTVETLHKRQDSAHPAHTGVPSEKAQCKSALPPLPSQGMVPAEAWGRVPHSCPSFSSSMQPLPKWLSTKAKMKTWTGTPNKH